MNRHQILPTLALTTAAVLATPAAAVAAPSPEPTPSATAARAEAPTPEAGSVEITKKDPAGDVLSGAAFLLLDAAGQEAGSGKTDAQGKLTFSDLAPGVYRLKETASGSPLHEVVADQDVIVTPGAATRLTITDPFKAAKILLQAKDSKTGKLLPGATVNIGTGSTLLTLTTGAGGTAAGELPVTSRKTQFWAKQIKAPAGYDLYKLSKTFTAGPSAPVTVTVTNAKTATSPKPTPSDKPTGTPSTPTVKPSSNPTGAPRPKPTDSSTSGTGSSPTVTKVAPTASAAAAPTGDSTPATPTGFLAHTGADTTSWIAGGAGLLVVAGAAALVVTRRRGVVAPEPDDTSETI
ncbi:collagen binding domain-containing protein [Streptomyces sp. CC210A]|uniref:MSCRAMM family protein n=1 Tax=Streptomyces sp. CC210A TaxID=2898184 RepID=UPI001F3D6473|nr:SpaA isopeptide-forming pilin-related protein [Streptomyces sp. CC210A]